MTQVNAPVQNLLVIDSQVSDWQSLTTGVGTDTAVLILDSGSDGLSQISNYLTTLAASTQDFAPLQSLQIISHGSAGSLLLGSSTLTTANLKQYTNQLASIGNNLTATGDIFLYGCNVATGQTGLDFINQFATLTSADVAASNDVTGSAALGGNWQLEASTGTIEVAGALSANIQATYADSLATIIPVVTITTGITAVEGAAGSFIVTLDSPAPAGGLTINYSLSGTATLNTDYTVSAGANITSVTAGSFTIAAGQTTANLQINANNDGIADPNETIKLILNQGTGYQFSYPAAFDPKMDFATGAHPSSVSVGDFNGDGKTDLAVANSDSDMVSVLLRNAANTGFDPKMDFATGAYPSSVSVGDFNGDGKTDLAVTNMRSSTVSVLLRNATNIGFEPTVDFATGDTSKSFSLSDTSVGVGDFNGDGKTDLAVANWSGNSVSVLLRNAANTGFDPKMDFATGDSPDSVGIGDFNSDGKIDLAVGNFGSNKVSVLLRNAANAGFDPKVDYYASLGGGLTSVNIGDFNGDGKTDLALINIYIDTVSVLLRNAANTGFDREVDVTTGSIPHSVKVGDFNGDGKTDLAVANSGSNTVSVLLRNTANTGFDSKMDFATGSGPSSVSTGDFNGDGKTDLAITNWSSNTVSVLLNSTRLPATLTATLTITDNIAPTLTAFASTVASGNKDSQIVITIANLQTQSNAVDVDGTISAFVIKEVNTGTLLMGASSSTATAWDAITNNTIDATLQAYWTPTTHAIGTLNAFTAVAKDNVGLESANAIQATVAVIDNIPPTVTMTDNFSGTAIRTTASIAYNLAFSEAVTGLDTTDFTVTNGTVSSVIGTISLGNSSGSSWTVNVTPALGVSAGSIGLTLKAGAVSDDAGNLNASVTNSSQAIDTVAPVAPKLITNAAFNVLIDPQLTLQTSLGAVVLDLNPALAPVTVANMLAYANTGFYDNTLFHRVMVGFMVQGGGLTSGLVNVTPTYNPIVLESNNGLSNLRGTIAMARTNAADSATSQFFVNLVDNAFLNYSSSASPGYAVFGKVVSGMSVIDRIAQVPAKTVGTYANVPVTDVKITSAQQTLAGSSVTNAATLIVSDLEVGAQWNYSLDSGSTWTAGTGNSFVVPVGNYAASAIQVRQTNTAGNVSASAGKLTSALVVETTAPTVTGFSPADGNTDAALANNIVLTFSEAIQKGTGLIQLHSGSATGTVIESFDAASSNRLALSGNTLTIDPTNNLANNTQYFVTFDSGSVKDLAGNNYAGISSYDFTTVSAETNGDDSINGTGSDDVINALAGNDNIYSSLGNDHIDGGTGNDTLVYDFNKSAITEVGRSSDGTLMIQSAKGTDTLLNIENLSFLDGGLSINELLAQSAPVPLFTSSASDGTSSYVMPTKYVGPVTFLDYQLLGNATGDVITGSTGNDFINLMGGDDAANGGAGSDVLDGGTGSNFLTGGSGNDTIFLDGRGGTTTWSTVTDFSAGDQVNIWGWNAGVSKQVFAMENQGADGYKGATFHYDLNNDGQIDTSITLTGLALSQVPAGVAHTVAGNGYLLIS